MMSQIDLFSKSLLGVILVAAATAWTPLSPVAAQNRESRDRAPELQELVRQLMTQLTISYRDDLPKYRERKRQLGRAISAWNASRRTDADFQLMADWLQGAIAAAMPGSREPLPSLPEFVGSLQPISSPTGRSNTGAAPQATEESATVAADRSPEETPSPDLFASGPALTDPMSTKAQPATMAAPVVEDHEPELTNSSTEQLPLPTHQDRDFWTEHPASRPLPAAFSPQDPFRDDPLPHEPLRQKSESVVAPASGSGRIDGEGKLVSAEPPTDNTIINLRELRARIRGFDQGLRRVESELMQPANVSAAQLMRLTDTIDDLLDQREFVELYLMNLSVNERETMPELRSANSAVEMLSGRVIEHRHALRRYAGGAAGADRKRDLLLLQQVSRKLTNLGKESWAD